MHTIVNIYRKWLVWVNCTHFNSLRYFKPNCLYYPFNVYFQIQYKMYSGRLRKGYWSNILVYVYAITIKSQIREFFKSNYANFLQCKFDNPIIFISTSCIPSLMYIFMIFEVILISMVSEFFEYLEIVVMGRRYMYAQCLHSGGKKTPLKLWNVLNVISTSWIPLNNHTKRVSPSL